jgi:peptidoglycan-associated lipoprotein
MKKLLTHLSLLAASAALLAACQSTPLDTDTKPATPTTTTTTTTPPTDTGTTKTMPTTRTDGNARGLHPLKDPANILSKRSVYFDYDSNVVRDEFRSMLQAHAKYLLENGDRKIRIEGNTDERGTREYNLALGSRRGDAIKKVLNVLGVPESRIEVVSLGKEKPKATSSDEAGWAENRRGDIAYDGE